MNKKMRARKRRQARRVALTLVLMLTVALVSIGGTIAWLTDKTDAVENTFTVGNIDIELAETAATWNETDKVFEKEFKMVPGNTIAKDPKVTIKANSEKSYVFVKITESANLDSFITYAPAAGWTALTTSATESVYYRVVEATTADVTYSVLNGDVVNVLDTVTKANMDALTEATYPTLTFQAYAIQFNELEKNGVAVTDAEGAWALLNA